MTNKVMLNRNKKLKIVLYKDAKKEWRWHAMRGKRILFAASEGYKNRNTMKKVLLNALNSIKYGEYVATCDGQVVDLWALRKW